MCYCLFVCLICLLQFKVRLCCVYVFLRMVICFICLFACLLYLFVCCHCLYVFSLNLFDCSIFFSLFVLFVQHLMFIFACLSIIFVCFLLKVLDWNLAEIEIDLLIILLSRSWICMNYWLHFCGEMTGGMPRAAYCNNLRLLRIPFIMIFSYCCCYSRT